MKHVPRTASVVTTYRRGVWEIFMFFILFEKASEVFTV
jgi:hypothetical protein